MRVLVVSSDDFDYAYQIFLTINDRGKRLSVEDIFRGEILGPLDRDQRERYEAIIDEMEKYREEAEPDPDQGQDVLFPSGHHRRLAAARHHRRA